MEPDVFLEQVKRRLRAMAANPPYVYRDTAPALIEAERIRLTEFRGYTNEEIAEFEARLGIRLPAVYRCWLREMGRSAGDLFCGSDLAGLATIEEFRARALALMHETDPHLELPREAVVFLIHQGYTFAYILANGEADSPVFTFVEGESEPHRTSPSLQALVEAELGSMEEVYAMARENGGYSRTLHADGSSSEVHPASGEKWWWQFWRR